MSIPKRNATIPGTYFVTSRTWQSRALFQVAAPCEIFVESLLKYRDQGRYQLHAFVLMPDHFHVLLTPSESIALERAVQFVKGGSAHEIAERLQMRFSVWQRGFSDHRVRSRVDYDKHLYYLLQNPVKRNLVVHPYEYKWPSAAGLYRMDEVPLGLKPLSMAAGAASHTKNLAPNASASRAMR